MKKKQCYDTPPQSFRGGKWFLIMRMTLFLLITNMFVVMAHEGFTQTSSVSLKARQTTVREAFEMIRQNSDYSIIYKSNDLDDTRLVDLNFEGASIDQVMKSLLKNEKVGYVVKKNQIIIHRTADAENQQQKRVVSGKVTDVAGLALPGVNVVIPGSSIGTVTDMDGNYSLEVPAKAKVLLFSFIGMKVQEVSIDNRTDINITLLDDAAQVDEVMVVGYGTQRKESVIGAISSLDIKDIKTPGASISNVLAGQLAGIVGMARSGEPGKNSAAEFYIRGVSSFKGNTKPLVLVDGIEREIDLVDTDDIASFSILKDASASAVYGVRGANGVIIITTRKGQTGAPRLNVRAETGLTAPTIMPKMVNSAQWAEMYNEAIGNEYYSQEEIEKYRTGSDPDLYPNVNWIDELYNDYASNQRVNLNLSGGGGITNYFVSGSYYNESSIFKDAGDVYDYNSSINYNKMNFRANIDFKLTSSTTLNVNLANIYEKSFGPGASTGDIWGYTYATSPNAFPLQYSDGTISAPSTSSGFNPWNLLVHSGYREQFWNSAQSLIGLKQDLGDIVTKGLTANIKFSWDAFNSSLQTRTKTPKQYHASGRDEDGNLIFGNPIYAGSETLAYGKETWGSLTTYLEGSLEYSRLFNEKHRVGGLFLYNHKIYNNTNAGDQISSLPYKNQGVAGRVTYAFRDTYFAEVNMGYNGSENFARGHRFGFFPAAALGWMVSSEEWFKPLTNYIDVLKLKASHGLVGNDNIGGNRRWIYQATIVNGGSFNYGATGNLGGTGIRMGDVENLSVSWEEAAKTNLGIELSLFNKARLQADYFHEKREGIFLQRAGLPAIAGLSTVPYTNIGKTKNQGFDASLEYDHKIGEVSLTARANFTYTRNELLNNDEPDWQYKYQNKIGKPFGSNGALQPFGLVALGLFESQEEIDNSPVQTFGQYRVGDIKYQDINGDGKIDTYDNIAIGYTNLPEIVYGFGATAQWRGFDVNAFFQGIDHVSFFVSGGAMRPFSSNNMERSAINQDLYKNGWMSTNTPEQNASAIYPRLSYGGGAGSSNNSQNSTFNQRDGSFLRLKNLEIGYSLPKSVLNKIVVKSLRFYLSGNNLITFSSFDLWDPEKGGGDGSGYPPSRVITLGLNASF